MTAGESLLLVFFGVLAIYCEFIRPGRVLPGVAGSLAAAIGIYKLEHLPLTHTGLILIATAAALFLLEAFWPVNFMAGTAATVSLSGGSALLVHSPADIGPGLAIAASVVFGGVTMLLCCAAKRARRNKTADLADGTPAQ